MKKNAVEKKTVEGQAAGKKTIPGKKLEEMDLLDDFLFGSVVTYPEIGEKFVRSILKIIFGREFKHLSVTAQKVFYGADCNLHGARLDVYLEPEMEYEDGASTLFLYTKGTEGIPSEALKQLLHYMEDTTYENAVNGELREIHRMVETVKKDPEVGAMRILMLKEVIELSEENEKLAEENAKQAEEITKQAEEIMKLREALNRKNADVKTAENG